MDFCLPSLFHFSIANFVEINIRQYLNRQTFSFNLGVYFGGVVYAGGSFRSAAGAARNFAPDEVAFAPGRVWASPASRANYPVQWTVQTPAGRYSVKAMLDDQELDSRGSTGSIYWEGLSELFDAEGRRVGRGYLEMTGYASRLRL